MSTEENALIAAVAALTTAVESLSAVVDALTAKVAPAKVAPGDAETASPAGHEIPVTYWNGVPILGSLEDAKTNALLRCAYPALES